MQYYIIGWGLGGSFGGIRNYEVIQVASEGEAEKWACENANEEYDSYDGMYGLSTVESLMEEDEGLDEGEAESIYREGRESWIQYEVYPYTKELEEKYSVHHFENRYKEEMEVKGEH
ncbi:MAG: hypothetical protein GY941_11175 [Planctomycetes bacterium]|nr:hypothetical protein [Planctomycetota bacterium]